MNPRRWFHRYSIWRRPLSEGMVQKPEPYEVIHANVQGLFEPAAAKRQESIIGLVTMAQIILTSASTDSAGGAVNLRPGDLVVAISGPGLTVGAEYEVVAGHAPLSDTMRPGGVPYLVAGLIATPKRKRPAEES